MREGLDNYQDIINLSLDSSGSTGSIGFYYGAGGGGAFLNQAHKAYLVVQEADAKA